MKCATELVKRDSIIFALLSIVALTIAYFFAGQNNLAAVVYWLAFLWVGTGLLLDGMSQRLKIWAVWSGLLVFACAIFVVFSWISYDWSERLPAPSLHYSTTARTSTR